MDDFALMHESDSFEDVLHDALDDFPGLWHVPVDRQQLVEALSVEPVLHTEVSLMIEGLQDVSDRLFLLLIAGVEEVGQF